MEVDSDAEMEACGMKECVLVESAAKIFAVPLW